jgi:hypothetical protein
LAHPALRLAADGNTIVATANDDKRTERLEDLIF